jgi:hypothetical protein
LITNQQELALTQIKAQVCQATIAANNLTGKTGMDLDNAMSAIKAACQ